MENWITAAVAAIEHVPDWVEALLAFVGAASAVAALTPWRRDDHWLSQIRRLLDVIALNIGHARRRDRGVSRRAPRAKVPSMSKRT